MADQSRAHIRCLREVAGNPAVGPGSVTNSFGLVLAARWALTEIDHLRAENASLREHAERLLRQAMGDEDVIDADERMAELLAALTVPDGASDE